MKIAQVVLSLIGLVAILLAYFTGKLEFLIIALAAFIGGLYYMGAIGRRSSKEDQNSATEKKKTGSAKDKSQKQQ